MFQFIIVFLFETESYLSDGKRPLGRKMAKARKKDKKRRNSQINVAAFETLRRNDLIEVYNATKLFEKDISQIRDPQALEFFTLVRAEYLQYTRDRTNARIKKRAKQNPLGERDGVNGTRWSTVEGTSSPHDGGSTREKDVNNSSESTVDYDIIRPGEELLNDQRTQ